MIREDLPDGMDDFPAATVSVYKILRDTEFETRRELREHTILADSTIQDALDRLREAGFIERVPDPGSPRCYRYSVVAETRQ